MAETTKSPPFYKVRLRAHFTLRHLTDAECRKALEYMVDCWKDPALVEFAIASVLADREGG